MAERRMFTKKITDDDRFMALSSSAQALYLHLSMSADDDGFSNQVSVSMFKAHASVQDLQALLENRYIYQFDNGVIVIKHWRMANALRKDRYTKTLFQEEFKKLALDEDGKYEWLPSGCQVVATCLPQGRIGEVRLDNNIIHTPTDTDFKSEFDTVWKEYPRKEGKVNAERDYIKARKEGVEMETILEGIRRYKEVLKANKTEMQYTMQGSTWFHQRRWTDEYTKTSSPKTGEERDYDYETIYEEVYK